jgi:ABC-type nickel/cobalt efflux system permease component RcnA
MKLFIACTAILGLSAVSAMAGEGRLSHQSLAKVGLTGMTIMSDSQGMEIRGLGVADGSYGDQGDNGQKGDKNKHHEKKQHENKHHEHKQQDCHEHQHEKCGQSACHVSSLCHVQTSCRTR